MHTPSVYIGTSGYSYKHWLGTFYPLGTKASGQLQEYLKTFRTVEVNYSFYQMPAVSTFQKWKQEVPNEFTFVLKANKFITHNKKLHDVADITHDFFSRAKLLGKKLGPVLFQLPPKWNVNTERLADFLKIIPKGFRCAFEFRNHTWYTDDVFALLRKHQAAFCIYELDGHLSPLEVTADFVYLRLHGPGAKYQGSYSDKTLKAWARHCRAWMKQGKDVYVYFDNDQFGYAAFNAQTLKKLLHA